ncbi:MAG: ATP-binding protein [Pyrinomonadaceae bacterium]
MATRKAQKALMSVVTADEFVGRDRELDAVSRHALEPGRPFGMLVSSIPGGGASELLRQLYDRLFFGQKDLIPFYFNLRPGDRCGSKAAERYLQQFLLQAAAFRRKEPAVLDSSPDIEELAGIAPQADAFWFDPLIEAARRDKFTADARDRMRSALSAPLRASAHGPRVFAMIDDLHVANQLEHGDAFVDELTAIFSRAQIPFVFAARRRFRVSLPDVSMMPLDALDFADGGVMVERYCASRDVSINEQTRDLIATQFGGVPFYIRLFLAAARDAGRPLDGFQKVEQLYARQTIDGSFARHFGRLIDSVAVDAERARKLVELLHNGALAATPASSPEAWQRRLDLETSEFRRLIRTLEIDEMIDSSAGQIRTHTENLALTDHLEARFRIENSAVSPATVEANLVASSLRRAPRLMSRLYRREAAAGLQDLMLGFDVQTVPAALVDYRRFRDNYRGRPDAEIRREIVRDAERVELPQISHAAPLEAHHPAAAELIDEERSAVGVGFIDRSYAEHKQVAWLAVEIDSKLEADEDAARFWCNQLEAAAAACDFANFQIWLVAPEGFNESALRLLDERGAYGSSRRQVELLKEFIASGGVLDASASEEVEYEMVIPMGDDTEMIAAHALEEIARRHEFPPKTINQLKTALVEACINATEHGLSPDRKIHQKFRVGDRRIVITISNRGLRLIDKAESAATPADIASEPAQPVDDQRRGWGLNLMRTLMDDVRVEQVDDGTRITMTKYLDLGGLAAA